MDSFQIPTLIVAAALLIIAAAIGMKHDRIPAKVPMALALLLPIYALGGPVDWIAAAGAAGAVLLLGIPLAAAGRLGVGHIKLTAALALWTGAELLPAFLVSTALALSTIAVMRLGYRALRSLRRRRYRFAYRPMTAYGRFPYGLAICAGGLSALWSLAGY